MDQRDRASLSTHVLDAAGGGPVTGVRVEVHARGGREAGAGVTDGQGRIVGLAADLDPGEYRISWHTQGAFVNEVSVTVVLGPGHHHVPLLSSGASAVVYRGV